MSGRSTFSRALLLAGALLIGAAIAAQAVAAPEPKGPGDISHEIAEAKARFYARISVLESTPTTNQDYYDAMYYWLDLDMDPTTQTVSGTVRMEAEVVTGPLASADIDLYDNMIVDSVLCAGTSVTYSHGGDILSVDLDREMGARTGAEESAGEAG